MSWNTDHGYPDQNSGARAWAFPCPHCPPGAEWVYLLANAGFLLLLQCSLQREHVFEIDSRTRQTVLWWAKHVQDNAPVSRLLLLPRRFLIELGLTPN